MYHKPQATPWYNCLVQCNRAQGLIWAQIVHVAITLRRSVALLLTAKTDQILHTRISLKGRECFSWGRRSHSCRCELLSLVVATCVETIADAEQQLNKTVVSSRLLLGMEHLLFSLRCWVPGSDSVAATPPGKLALLTLSLKRSDGH